ncbi:MAG: lipocalin family protein [Mucinivorans sp.]
MTLTRWIASLVQTIFSSGSCRTTLRTVDRLDVARYMGRWYEIASYPMWFEANMSEVKANYILSPRGEVEVYNSGLAKGKVRRARGKALVVDRASNAKLKVSFFGPFYAPYWVIALGDDYSWAVVSDPRRRTLWILARRPVIGERLYESICEDIARQGFDLSRLRRMAQREVGE